LSLCSNESFRVAENLNIVFVISLYPIKNLGHKGYVKKCKDKFITLQVQQQMKRPSGQRKSIIFKEMMID